MSVEALVDERDVALEMGIEEILIQVPCSVPVTLEPQGTGLEEIFPALVPEPAQVEHEHAGVDIGGKVASVQACRQSLGREKTAPFRGKKVVPHPGEGPASLDRKSVV